MTRREVKDLIREGIAIANAEYALERRFGVDLLIYVDQALKKWVDDPEEALLPRGE